MITKTCTPDSGTKVFVIMTGTGGGGFGEEVWRWPESLVEAEGPTSLWGGVARKTA